MLKTGSGRSCDSLQETDRAVLLALSILIDRIHSLPEVDKDDLFRLLKESSNTGDQEEQQAIRSAIEEILANMPVAVRDLPPPKKLSKNSTKWAEHVGKTIKELRSRMNMTQVELAGKAGIPQSHLSRLESATYTPTHMTLVKVAKALGVPVQKLDPCLD